MRHFIESIFDKSWACWTSSSFLINGLTISQKEFLDKFRVAELCFNGVPGGLLVRVREVKLELDEEEMAEPAELAELFAENVK